MGIIFNSEIIEKITCKISCGVKDATAFLISNKYAVTATHCISEYTEDTPIKLEFRNISNKAITCEARPIEDISIHKLPIVILELINMADIPDILPKFTSTQPKPGMEVAIYGYPQVKSIGGLWTKGIIARAITEDQVNAGDWNLYIGSLNTSISSFDGYSGSPLLHNGKVIGIIGEQTLDSGRAITINAIDTKHISNYLRKYDVIIGTEEPNFPTKDSVFNRPDDAIVTLSNTISTLSALNQKLSEDYTTILDKKYNNIVEIMINGAIEQAQIELDDVLSSEYSKEEKAYAKFYFLAAQWVMEEDSSLADQYINIACKLDEDIDTRIYLSSLYQQKNDFDNAEAVLYPIDSTILLNQWLILQYKLKRNFDIDDVLNKYKHIKLNDGTYYCLCLNYLRMSNFDKAKEYVNLLTKTQEHSCICWDISALIYYWEAISQQMAHEPGEIFVVFLNGNMPFTRLQIKSAEIALENYQKALELALIHKNSSIKNNALIGSLIINWMLNRFDSASKFAVQLLDSDKGNPIAVQFLIANGECPDKYMEDIMIRSQGDAFSALVYIKILLQQGKCEQANTVFSDYQDSIKKIAVFEWVALQLEIKLKQNKIADSYDLLSSYTQELQEDEVLRFTLYIFQFDNMKNEKEQIALAEKIKNNYGAILDYQNLCNIYRRFNKWNRIPRVAKEWYKKYNDLMALNYLAQSQFYRKYAKKALKTLKQIEKIHVLPINLKRIKVDCLAQIADFNSALEIIKDIGLSDNDENLVVQQAKIELTKGNLLEAIHVLRTFVDYSEHSISATLMLADLLEKDSPKEAFEIINKLRKAYPENKDIAMKAMYIGFMSGNDQEAHQLMMKLSQDDLEEKYIKKMAISDAIDLLNKQAERNKELDRSYLDGLLPQHSYFDLKNYGLGYHVYSRWVLAHDYPLFWCYGGRPDNSLTDYFNDQVILDYSAILTITCLDLFPLVERTFSCIIVSPNLIPCIIDEMKTLSIIQESVRQKHEGIYKFFHQLNANIRIVDACPILPEQNIATPNDYIEYNTAQKYNAQIVTDSFACETLYQTAAPHELSDLQIYECEIWEILYRKGLVPKRQYDRELREEKIQRIVQENTALLVNLIFLEELAEVANVSDVGSVLSLIILKAEVDTVGQYIRGVEEQEKCIQWLEAIRKKLVSLEQKGALRFCPLSDRGDPSARLTSILIDSLEYGSNEGIPIWIDDRSANSYLYTQNGIEFGIFDFIHTLNFNDLISAYEYRNLVSSLINNKILYHVPPLEYIFSILKIATTNDGRNLNETDSLTKIRRYISLTLISSSNIGKTQHANTTLPEEHGFLLILNRHCHDLLKKIWNEKEATQDWKIAASNWVWKYLSDFTCDVRLDKKFNVEDGITAKHALLIFNSLLINPSNVSGYSDWVFLHLYLYWIFNPDNKLRVAHAVAVLLCTDRSDRIDIPDIDLYEEILLVRLQRIMPPDFFGLVLEDPLCKSKWENRYEEIQIEMTAVRLPLDLNNDAIKYESDCDLIEELRKHPDNWKDIFAAVIQYSDDNPLVTTISFMNSYIDKHGSKDITNECKNAIEELIWYTPVEYRIDIQELRRRF